MKNYYIFFVLFCVNFLFAQNPEIKTDLPTIIPPSPSVSALMKFEEVPVSNYTGIPDVSIPLFSSATRSKKIGIDLSLKYHPSSVGADERAGDVGLGWSLFAGGTISRTVRSLPDEIVVLPTGGQSPAADPIGKIGLYHTNHPNHPNNYNYFTENIANSTQDYYQPNLSQQAQDIGNEFIWNTTFKGKYDTEHDLWQFNFMGKSGRFYIKKNASNQLEIVPLEDYRIKIINHYSTENNSFIPTAFTVYDELGNKYLFDVVETSRNFGGSSGTYYSYISGYSTSDSIYSERLFNSSFHLSKVYDNNDNLLIEYLYDPSTKIEGFSNNSTTYNEYLNTIGYLPLIDTFTACQDFPPIEAQAFTNTNIYVKKLNSINVSGVAKIYFTFLQGRADNNITNGATTSYLNDIIIRDWNGEFIKKYSFEYDYITHTNTYDSSGPVVVCKRLILEKINIIGTQNFSDSNYEFSYEDNTTSGKIIGKDFWGYFNLVDTCYLTTEKHRNTSPEYSTTDILQKIKYPTGGCAIFNYEANQYSYIGNQEVTNFDENPDSYTKYDEEMIGLNDDTTTFIILPSTSNRKLKFYPGIYEGQNRKFTLKKNVNGVWSPGDILICHDVDHTCCFDFIIEANVEYKILRENFNEDYEGTDNLTIEYYNLTPKYYLYGGGNRIKKIGYFEGDAPQDYYKLSDNSSFDAPEKEKNYNYNLFDNALKSSGSLVFAKPLFNYWTTFTTQISAGYQQATCSTPYSTTAHGFQTLTSYNNLSITKTHGSDVGYKEITVYETNNGKIEYTYSSPLEHPEEDIPSGPPFVSTKNFDYKRGLPMKEAVYDSQNRKLSENESSYIFVNYLEHTGTRFRKPFGECYTGGVISNYDNYLFYLSLGDTCLECRPEFGTRTGWLCGLPLDLLTPKILLFPIFEAYGWAKLSSKTTKSYFYDQSNTPRIVETIETYQYNPVNKMLSESTNTNSYGEILKTKYFYHTGSTSITRNRISEIEKIETYRGTALLSTSQINYANNWPSNISDLPHIITTSKGLGTLENRVRFNKYDEYGNTLELQQENGTMVSYIWGYNKSQPVAKIENLGYNSIPSNLVADIQYATDNQTEANVISALNLLRSNPALNGAMVTTYTYKPLVGVSTITDPKGDKMTYMYDAFQRLEAVYDKAGNKLSENEYNYRTQN